MPIGVSWRSFNIERNSHLSRPDGEFLAWAMHLPVHVFDWGIVTICSTTSRGEDSPNCLHQAEAVPHRSLSVDAPQP